MSRKGPQGAPRPFGRTSIWCLTLTPKIRSGEDDAACAIAQPVDYSVAVASQQISTREVRSDDCSFLVSPAEVDDFLEAPAKIARSHAFPFTAEVINRQESRCLQLLSFGGVEACVLDVKGCDDPSNPVQGYLTGPNGLHDEPLGREGLADPVRPAQG